MNLLGRHAMRIQKFLEEFVVAIAIPMKSQKQNTVYGGG